MVLNIITLNVNGLRDSLKRRSIFEYYRKRCDILCLQETHATNDCERQWTAEWGGKCLLNNGESNSRGVAIMFKPGLQIDISQVNMDNTGRILTCNIIVEDAAISIMNVYGPNKDSPEFFVSLFKRIPELKNRCVIAGDLNVIMNPTLDKRLVSEKCKPSNAATQIKCLMEECLIQDVWRCRNPDARRYSWFRNQQASRLDYFLISDGLAQFVHDTYYITGIKSDHSAMFISFEFASSDRGPSYWKFNTLLLHDSNFLQLINDLLDAAPKKYTLLSPKNRWEAIKKDIMEKTKIFSKTKINVRRECIADLSASVTQLENNFHMLNDEEMHELNQSKAELDELLNENIRGIIFRSQCKWYEYGECNSRYFFSLEKAKYNAKTCHVLTAEDGNLVKDPSDILKMQQKYYQTLYQKDENVVFSLKSTPPCAVPEHMKSAQETDITMDEVSAAVRQLANNKAPGPDGIPVDFYKVFWAKLSSLIQELIAEVYSTEMLHTTGSRGVLNLIPKKGKDPKLLKI